jgi:TonB-dependent receptor
LSSTSNTFTSIYDAQYAFNVSSGNSPFGESGTGRNYSIQENIAAGYGQFKWALTSKLEAIGGVRLENTDQHYTTNLPVDVNAQYGHIYYADVLPSLHLKYAINNQQNIRASYFRSLVRPGFVELIPQDIPASENDAYEQQGNPYLKHTTADNYDVRYELFPKGKGSDQFLIGGFLKRIYNPIEVTFSHYSVIGGNPSPGTNILTPTNVGDVTNYGAELVYTKFIGKFGVNANYTYTHSATTTNKYYLSYDTVAKKNVTSSVSQTRPLQGQAKHIANLSLIFKNPKSGTDMQLAYVYTGERIALVNTFYNLDTWQSPYSQLDFSFEQKLVKKLAIYGKINNLLNSKTRYFIKQPYLIGNTLNKIPGQDDPTKSIFVQQDIYKISYLFGLRYKL